MRARDRLAALDLRVLHIDRADAELPVSEQSFVMMCHVMLDQYDEHSILQTRSAL